MRVSFTGYKTISPQAAIRKSQGTTPVQRDPISAGMAKIRFGTQEPSPRRFTRAELMAAVAQMSADRTHQREEAGTVAQVLDRLLQIDRVEPNRVTAQPVGQTPPYDPQQYQLHIDIAPYGPDLVKEYLSKLKAIPGVTILADTEDALADRHLPNPAFKWDLDKWESGQAGGSALKSIAQRVFTGGFVANFEGCS